jgi:hypothetical protein
MMHLLLVVAALELKCLPRAFVIFSLKTLNEHIQEFDYGYHNKDKPSKISSVLIQGDGKINQNGNYVKMFFSSYLYFYRLFPLGIYRCRY